MADISDSDTGTVVERGIVSHSIENNDVQRTTAGTSAIWAATAGKKHHVTDMIVSVDTAMTVTIKDGAATILEVYLAVNGGFIMNFQTPLQGSTNTALNVTTSVNGKMSVTVTGYDN